MSKNKYVKNERGGAKTDTIVKLILVFFVSLLSFSVGTFVGKQFSDSQHKLAALEQDYGHEVQAAHGSDSEGRSTASVNSDHMEVEPSEVLSKEEVAKLAEEFVQDGKEEKTETAPNTREVAAAHPEEKHESAHGHDSKTEKPNEAVKKEITAAKQESAAHETAAQDHSEKPSLVEKSKGHGNLDAAQKIAEGKPALEPVVKPIAPKKIELPKVTATDVQGKYTIQISSHPNETDAKNHAADLVSKGYSAFYIPAQIDGKTWYRVSVGNFTTADSAKEYLSQIKSVASFKGAIVRKVVQ